MTNPERKARRLAAKAIFDGDPIKRLVWMREQNDSVLDDIVKGEWSSWQGNNGFDRPLKISKVVREVAKGVLSRRTVAATAIREALARAYQCPNIVSFSQWQVIPCRTDSGNIGVVDISKGTAFDLNVQCPIEAEDLGLVGEVYAGANNAGAGLFISEPEVPLPFDTPDTKGKTAKALIATVEPHPGGKAPDPSMPPGWQQIALPSWRGWDGGDGQKLVPESLYRTNPLRPTQVAYGLKTCYGEPGKPRRYLNDYQEQNATQPWLLADFERIDPSWWQISEDQEKRMMQLIGEWTKKAFDQLASLQSENEVCLSPTYYPDQEFSAPVEERTLSWLRAEAARSAADLLMKETGIYFVHTCREWSYSPYYGRIQGVLVRMLYERLKPVLAAVSWMYDLSNIQKNCGYYGQYSKQLQSLLLASATEMGRALCSKLDTCSLVEKDLVAILYENGPVFLKP